MLMRLRNADTPSSAGFGSFGPGDHAKPIVSHVRPNGNLYGGSSDAAKANTRYIFIGHFQPINADVFAQNGNSWVFNNVEVFGGDVVVDVMDIARVIADDSAGTDFSSGMFFPIQSRVNVSLRFGRHLNKERSKTSTYHTDDGIDYPGQLETALTAGYFPVYSYEESVIDFPAKPQHEIPSLNHPTMVMFSGKKLLGERIDNWRVFQTNNQIEVEAKGESITNLRTKHGRLFYWQKKAIGYLPIEERGLVPDALGNPIVLGEGGTLTRFDESTNYFGNQHRGSLCETETGFVWFDMRNRSFMQMSAGGNIVELSAVKGLHQYFHNAFSGNILSDDNSILGKGIISVYDPRYKRVMMTFRGVSNNSDDDFTLLYSHIHNEFRGFSPGLQTLAMRLNDVVITSTPQIANVIQGSFDYVINNRVVEGNSIYVCTAPYTSASVPVAASLDGAHWSLASTNNQVYVEDKGDVAKFFGIVEDSIIEFLINQQYDVEKDFYTWKWLMNEFMWTNVRVSNDNQSGADVLINPSVNTDYERRNNHWLSNVPLDINDARLFDHYLRVRLEKNNFDPSVITNSANEKIKFVSLITEIQQAF